LLRYCVNGPSGLARCWRKHYVNAPLANLAFELDQKRQFGLQLCLWGQHWLGHIQVDVATAAGIVRPGAKQQQPRLMPHDFNGHLLDAADL
jgi:hypothetical protein